MNDFPDLPAFLDRRERLEFHPIANCFPLIDGTEFEELVADIKANGQREPVILYEGQILDGRNRYRACWEAGVDCKFESYDGDDPLRFVVSLNLRRRHLSEGQRAWVAAKISNLGWGQRAAEGSIDLSSAAAMMNVSEPSVKRARVVRDHGVAELQEKVASGQVAPSTAADVARLPKPEQREIVARGEKEILEAAKRIRAGKADERRAELVQTAIRKAELPEGKFSVIVIDPPWPMEKISRDVAPEQVAFDYPTMSEEELVQFGQTIEDMAGDDCHMFMWTTQKFLPMSMRLLTGWGFKYVLTMVWRKSGGFQPFGLPQFNCEFVLYGRRGSPIFAETKDFFACFDGPRREHSRKPDCFYETIKRVSIGRRIDVFSREKREGYEQFGNEADKFSDEAA